MPTSCVAFASRAVILAAAFCSAGLLATTPAVAGKYKVLYSFCAEENCADGTDPSSKLLIDAAGDIFGETESGGGAANGGAGVLFEMTSSGRGHYKYNVVYDFCMQANCADGSLPVGSLVMDKSGNLYGVTAYGGSNGDGEVFELKPTGANWSFNVLYSFCSLANCDDGAQPIAGLTYAGAASGSLYDGTSPLYGTTAAGAGGGGAAYAVQPGNGGWSEQVLYAFGGEANGQAPLVIDASGNLYGTEANNSIVYELSPSRNKWSETTLYTFPCPGRKCRNGTIPGGGVVIDSAGRLWGLTDEGGRTCRISGYQGFGCGTVYSLDSGGNGFAETVWHNFCRPRRNCADGAFPFDTPVLDAQGDLLGTTSFGGKFDNAAQGSGTLFELNPNSQKFSVLHGFCGGQSCADGSVPGADIVLDSRGNVYGTTSGGGKGEGGTVFQYAP